MRLETGEGVADAGGVWEGVWDPAFSSSPSAPEAGAGEEGARGVEEPEPLADALEELGRGAAAPS